MKKLMFRMMSETIYPLFRGIPRAYAHINGSEKYPDIKGMVLFYPYENGTVVVADIGGLPMNQGGMPAGGTSSGANQGGPILGFHIHEGFVCSGNETDPFADAGMHYSKEPMQHPEHSGDMPVLFVNQGKAWMAFFTDRFTADEVRGRAVIVHAMPDDFRTNPAGNSGERIACGVIR